MKTIGILGGMGSYATCDVFRRLLDAFPAEKEWERPRILIDNRCTMPSRVRAILYGEQEELLIKEMSESVENLAAAGAEQIFLGCMTAHYFRDRLPCQDKLLNGLELTKAWMAERYPKGTKIFCMCTEGSAATGIWTKALPDYQLHYPNEQEMFALRDHIETVKKNQVTPQARESFREYIRSNRKPDECTLLGCTELPVLYGTGQDPQVVDPIACIIQFLKDSETEKP